MSSEAPVKTTRCPACSATFEDWFAACPFCQAPLARPDRGAVLVSIFLGLGAFASPALWRSRAFSPREKLWLTVAAVAYSCSMVAIIVVAFRLFLSFYRQLPGAS